MFIIRTWFDYSINPYMFVFLLHLLAIMLILGVFWISRKNRTIVTVSVLLIILVVISNITTKTVYIVNNKEEVDIVDFNSILKWDSNITSTHVYQSRYNAIVYKSIPGNIEKLKICISPIVYTVDTIVKIKTLFGMIYMINEPYNGLWVECKEKGNKPYEK